MSENGFCNVQETADALNISISAVQGLIKRERLRAIKIKGRYVIEGGSIDRYMRTKSFRIGQARKARMVINNG